ncbi:MAG: hypothetical protein LQ347_001623 [Umbilicaria vellea]|nr:MAG: hypothetical protein LQ347_001623 [Umbilicaria vellea]
MADSKLERLEELQQVWREMLVNHQVWRLRWNTMLEERRILLGTPLDSGERRQIEGHVMTLEVVVARHDENVKADIITDLKATTPRPYTRKSTGKASTAKESAAEGSTGEGSTAKESAAKDSTGEGSTAEESAAKGSTGEGSTAKESAAKGSSV